MSRRASRQIPAAQGDDRPYGFDSSKRPGTLQKAVNRPQEARNCEGKDKPAAALFQRVRDQHGGNGEESKEGQAIQEITSEIDGS